jgi:hypothetical protein
MHSFSSLHYYYCILLLISEIISPAEEKNLLRRNRVLQVAGITKKKGNDINESK